MIGSQSTELMSALTDEQGLVDFQLPEGLYTLQATYNNMTYQSVGEVIADKESQAVINTNGETLSVTLRSSPSTVLENVECFLYSASGEYLNQSALSDDQGMVSFNVAHGEYVVKAAYLGGEFSSDVLSVPEHLSTTLLIEHQTIAVTVEGDFGTSKEPLTGVRCALFTESGQDTGLFADTDSEGVAHFSVPFNNYQAKVTYLGNDFSSEPFDWFNTTLSVPHGTLNLHLARVGRDAKNATVKLFSPAGDFLGLTTNTDKSGNGSFELPAGAYKLQIIHKGDKYWSDVIFTQAYTELFREINLNELALNLTNNPSPKTIHGTPPEYRIRLASLDSFFGLFATSATAVTPNTELRTFYYVSDHLGTAQLMVDQEQTVVWKGEFKPFGQVDTVINELDNNFRFPGQYFDTESGLHQTGTGIMIPWWGGMFLLILLG